MTERGTGPAATILRIMTFNVRGAYHQQDGANAWPERRELNVATILQAHADLIGLQEAQADNLKTYRQQLGDYHYACWPEYGNQQPLEYPAIFWKPTRLQPIDSGGFWLSDTPECWSRSWGTDNIRAAAWLKFFHVGSGATLVHLNTHLDHRSEPARVEGTRLILARLDGLTSDGAAAFVTGDFNTPVGSATYHLFADAGFADLHLASGNDQGPSRSFTYHGFEGASFRGSDERPRRIDWILGRSGTVTHVEPNTCEIIRDHADPLYPSDHYPVLAEVTLTPR